MKVKIKPAWIGLFLIATMLFSTFAYAVIQSLYPKNTAKLPTSNIVDYALDSGLVNALIQYGQTVITFEYNMVCNNCINQKAGLEFFANEYKNQIWLEELVNESLDASTITISSPYGSERLTDADDTQIFESLCRLMAAPPVSCALQRT